ncbi:MAG: hypothetical protein FWF29_10335, partial [Treponema sp.]|nr:hypothetical protein [Treponema sp.]
MNIVTIEQLLEYIYGKSASQLLPKVIALLEAFLQEYHITEQKPAIITNKDALLISYGDMLSSEAGETEE